MDIKSGALASKSRRCKIIGLAGLLGCAGGTVSTAAVASGSATACQKTVGNMAASCYLELREEFRETFANCLNFADAADRNACREEANDTLAEDGELCEDQRQARFEVCSVLGEERYAPDPLLDPSIDFIDPDSIPSVHAPNSYFSLQAGRTLVLRAGEDFEELVVVHATGDTREIQGVSCRVVVDVASVVEEDEEEGGIEYVAEEITDDWYAQDQIGNVYYCGELSRNFEDGTLDNLDGSFEAGKDFAKAGVLIKASPMVGDAYRQEFALGEAEDLVRYMSLDAVPSDDEGGENPAFPCAPAGCLKTFEWNPLEPESTEFKYYLAGVGLVLAVPLEDGEITGEREELLCAGDSLEVLQDPACGIDDPDALLEQLCELAPHAFCEDDVD
ncbi:hypothetical protein BH24PSE2_BH24PSE2_24820 [soil metagenome]